MDLRQMSPQVRVAILLLSIDQDLAAEILRNMADDQVHAVTRAMKELQEIAVDRNTITSIYNEMVKRLRSGGMALGDVASQMEDVLVKAFGESRGIDVTRRADHEILARRPFAVFEALNGEDLAALLMEEHPQIAAVFLAHLDRSKASAVIHHLPTERRSDLIRRVANLDRTPPEVVQRVLDVMRKKVKDLGLMTRRTEPKAWVKAAAEILNHLDGNSREILDDIAEQDDRIATEIRDEMFTFDDLAALDRRSMQRVLGQIDTRVLALAMKAATAAVEDNVFNNLSKRAAAMVQEERDILGPTPLSEVLEAQQEVLMIVRDLMDRGEVKVAGVGEQLI